MYKNSRRGACKISTSTLYQNAIFKKVFQNTKFDLYKELYKNLPEDNTALKIIKLRKTHNLERQELAELLGFHLTAVEQWEKEDVLPKPESIKTICDKLNVPLNYFHEYYNIYFSNYREKIRNWKNQNSYTYAQVMKLLDISHSGFARLLNGRINLSYNMYLKLKELKVF